MTAAMSPREIAQALEIVGASMRRLTTAMAVRDGLACPEPGCGLQYRHQHDEIWWPPEGEPWPPRRWHAVPPAMSPSRQCSWLWC